MKALARITLVALLVISFSVTIYAQEATWEDLYQQAYILSQDGRYSEAAEVTKEALKIAENKFGPEHPNVRTILLRLAGIYGAQGKHTEARDLYKRALGKRFDLWAADQEEKFDLWAAGQEEESGFFAALVALIIAGSFALPILAGFVLSSLYEKRCPKCHEYSALKTIAQTKLEPDLYKYEYQCKYCTYEFERIVDTTPIPVLYW